MGQDEGMKVTVGCPGLGVLKVHLGVKEDMVGCDGWVLG